MANSHCTGGRTSQPLVLHYGAVGSLLVTPLYQFLPLSKFILVWFLWTPEEALTVFVNCIIAATFNMPGLSSQVVVLLINISLLNPQQEVWAYFQIKNIF